MRKLTIQPGFHTLLSRFSPQVHSFLGKELHLMAGFDKSMMKLDGADSPAAIAVSSIVVLGSIAVLVLWAMRAAYL
jgi:hypothetical protein